MEVIKGGVVPEAKQALTNMGQSRHVSSEDFHLIRIFRPHLGGGQLHLRQRGEDRRPAGRHQRLRSCE